MGFCPDNGTLSRKLLKASSINRNALVTLKNDHKDNLLIPNMHLKSDTS